MFTVAVNEVPGTDKVTTVAGAVSVKVTAPSVETSVAVTEQSSMRMELRCIIIPARVI